MQVIYPFKTAPSAIEIKSILNINEKVGFTFYFDNGYGASVSSDGSGSEKSPYELAVLSRESGEWDLCYTSPITNNVVGWLNASEVDLLLEQIKNLEPIRTYCLLI